MNWLTNVVRPKIRNILRRETPENLWIKCPDSGQLVFYKDVEANQFVIPGSNYHMAGELIKNLAGIDIVHIPYKGSTGARADIDPGGTDAADGQCGHRGSHRRWRAGRERCSSASCRPSRIRAGRGSYGPRPAR